MILQVKNISGIFTNPIKTRILICLFFTAVVLFVSVLPARAQAEANQGSPLVITAEKFAENKNLTTANLVWKYRVGDDAAWAGRDFDDRAWDSLDGSTVKLESPPASGWNGRAWFRLKFKIDESAAAKKLAILVWHFGASEIFLDGRRLVGFGEIDETGQTEYNPGWVPVPFEAAAGEHVLAVRYSASMFAGLSGWQAAWLERGSINPGFQLFFREMVDLNTTIQSYADASSMRIGFLFVGVLTAFALLHLLLFLFYRVERANLFYSIYALALALSIVAGNLQTIRASRIDFFFDYRRRLGRFVSRDVSRAARFSARRVRSPAQFRFLDDCGRLVCVFAFESLFSA